MDQDIDPVLFCRTKFNRNFRRQVLERSAKRKQGSPTKSPTYRTLGFSSPTKKTRKNGKGEDLEIVSLFGNRKKDELKDGLYKFVLWREAWKEEMKIVGTC